MFRASTATLEPAVNTTAWTPSTICNSPCTPAKATRGRDGDFDAIMEDEEMLVYFL